LNSELLKLSITFWLSVVDLPSETKKATHWSPFPAVVSRAYLACAPPGKGEFIGVRSLLAEAMPAWPARGERRRCGEKIYRFHQK